MTRRRGRRLAAEAYRRAPCRIRRLRSVDPCHARFPGVDPCRGAQDSHGFDPLPTTEPLRRRCLQKTHAFPSPVLCRRERSHGRSLNTGPSSDLHPSSSPDSTNPERTPTTSRPPCDGCRPRTGLRSDLNNSISAQSNDRCPRRTEPSPEAPEPTDPEPMARRCRAVRPRPEWPPPITPDPLEQLRVDKHQGSQPRADQLRANPPPRCCRSVPGAAAPAAVPAASRRSPAVPASTTASEPRSRSVSLSM